MFTINYNIHQEIAMVRKCWTPEEQQLLLQLSLKDQNERKIKWARIAASIKMQIPEFNRTGKQCRQRWLIIRPRAEFPQITNHSEITNNLEKFFCLLRKNKRKWCLIAEHFPSQAPNSIKNYFFCSVKKGLKNLKVFNHLNKDPQRYKNYGQKLLQKLVALWEGDPHKSLIIQDEEIFGLSEKIIETLIKCSFQQITEEAVTEQTRNIYTNLHLDILDTLRKCKFKKCRAPKNKDDNKEKQTIDESKQKKRKEKPEEKLCQENLIKLQQIKNDQEYHKVEQVKIEQLIKKQQDHHWLSMHWHLNYLPCLYSAGFDNLVKKEQV